MKARPLPPRPPDASRLAGLPGLAALAALAGLAGLATPVTAQAHGLPSSPQEAVAGAWLTGLMLLLLTVALLLYATGLARLLARARRGRGARWRHAAWFAGGWLILAGALLSPLDEAGAVCFAAHMVQHELLMIVAAPMLVLGRPLGTWAWALPATWRRGLPGMTHVPALALAWRALTRPLHAWLLHFAALWLWHVPALFQAALRHVGVHALQHASFLFPALLFWWAVLGESAGRQRGAAIAYLFTTMLHTSALGALFALSGRLWYPWYGLSGMRYGLSPLEDQQLGGLIMWVPGGMAYVIAGLVLCSRWLQQPAGVPQGMPGTAGTS